MNLNIWYKLSWPQPRPSGSRPLCLLWMLAESPALVLAVQHCYQQLSSCLELSLWLPDLEACVASAPLSPTLPASARSLPGHYLLEAVVCSVGLLFDSGEIPSQSGWREVGGSRWGRWGFAESRHLVSRLGRYCLAWSSPRTVSRLLRQAVAPPKDMASFSHSKIMILVSFWGYKGWKLVSLFV